MRKFQTLLAVAAIALVGFVSSCNQTKTPDSGAQLYSNFFKPYEGPDVSMGSALRGVEEDESSSAMKETLAQGMSYYGQKQYAQAISYFEQYTTSNPTNLQVPFYLGVCHLAVENVDKAETQFKGLLNQPTSLYFEHSQWYTALINLNKGKLTESKAQLEAILKNKNHYYHDLAQDLIGQVDYMIEHNVKG